MKFAHNKFIIIIIIIIIIIRKFDIFHLCVRIAGKSTESTALNQNDHFKLPNAPEIYVIYRLGGPYREKL